MLATERVTGCRAYIVQLGGSPMRVDPVLLSVDKLSVVFDLFHGDEVEVVLSVFVPNPLKIARMMRAAPEHLPMMSPPKNYVYGRTDVSAAGGPIADNIDA